MHPRSSDSSSSVLHDRETTRLSAGALSTVPRVTANAVLDTLPDSIAVLDQSGTIVAVNEAWTRFARDNQGSALATGPGASYLAVCRAAANDATARRVLDGLSRILAGTGTSFTVEYPCHSQAKRRWFFLRAMPLPGEQAGAVVVHTDITERKLAEEERAHLLEVSQAAERREAQRARELEAVFASLPDGVVVFDQQGRVVRASEFDRTVIGFVPNEYLHERARRLGLHDRDGVPLTEGRIPSVRVLHGEVLTSDQPESIFLRLPDGQRLELSVTGAPIRDAEGRPVGGVIIYRDVTKERRIAHRYQAVLETAPDATMVVGSDGEIRLLNRQAEVLFGYARDELMGRQVETLIPERFHVAHRKHRADYRAAPRTRPMGVNLQLFGRRRDASEFPIEVSLASLQEDGESQVIVSVRDVSEVQRVQAANQELRRLLMLTDTALAHLELDDLLPELLVRVQDAMGADEAVILLVSADGRQLRVRAATGLAEDVAAGVQVPMGEGFVGRIAASQAPLIVDDLSTFAVANPVLRRVARSAVGVPLLSRGRVLGVVHVGTAELHHFTERDVQLLERVAERFSVAIERAELFEAEQQARRDAQAALSRALASEKRFQRLADSGVIGIAISYANMLIDANDAFLKMLGYTRDDLKAGKLTTQALSTPQEMRTTVERAMKEARTVGRCLPFEREYIHKDGSRVPVLTGIALLEREPPVFGSFVIDLTERKRLEHEREEALSNELAARAVAHQMDQFFAVASHDIRTPVTSLVGFVQLARIRGTRLADYVRAQDGKVADMAAHLLDDLEQAEESADRLIRMTTLLFDVARARSGTFTVSPMLCDLGQIVREQVEAQRMAVPDRTIHLHAKGAEPILVVADADRIGEVLANFVTNALKYSHNDQPVYVQLHGGKRRVRVAVRDRGPGLSPEDQAYVWDLFHRAPDVKVQSDIGTKSGSLGLGLNICKRILELHPGGRIGVISAVGKGSTFWFELPLAAAAS